MGKKFFLPVFVAVIGLMLSPLLPQNPFTLLVVDEQTGIGVPSLRVTNGDGMVRYTGAHGELIIWNKSSRFEIRDEKGQFVNVDAALQIIPGGHATLKVHRRSL